MPDIQRRVESERCTGVPQGTRPAKAGWRPDTRPLWKRERDRRREDKVDARNWGKKLPRLRWIGLVELGALTVPEWARKKAIRGLTITDTKVWLGRIAANFLARLDREAGGGSADYIERVPALRGL